jgi:omega-6 fatty acid desaturase (delta-12 desaturase)
MVALTASVAAGLSIALLFIVAHDACHGSLTPSSRLNRILGRICFLPSLYPLSSWELGHNRLHHGWTNLRHRDYVWCPLSYDEFQALSFRGRLIERLYRTTLGVGLYNLVEIWWKHMVFPSAADRQLLRVVENRRDRFLVLTYGLSVLGVLIWAAESSTEPSRTGVIRSVVLGLIVPLATFNWLSGFVIFQHHTHVRVPWYANRNEWSFFEGQIAGTVHVKFPKIVGLLFHNIMEHNAHHANPKIPLYDLDRAQIDLERSFQDAIVTVSWTLSDFRYQLRSCQLYDFDVHRWLTFQGIPTSEPLLPMRDIAWRTVPPSQTVTATP